MTAATANIPYQPGPFPASHHMGKNGSTAISNDFPPLHYPAAAGFGHVNQSYNNQPAQGVGNGVRAVPGVWNANGNANGNTHGIGSPALTPTRVPSTHISQGASRDRASMSTSSQIRHGTASPHTARSPGLQAANQHHQPQQPSSTTVLSAKPGVPGPQAAPTSPIDPDFPQRQRNTSQALFNHRGTDIPNSADQVVPLKNGNGTGIVGVTSGDTTDLVNGGDKLDFAAAAAASTSTTLAVGGEQPTGSDAKEECTKSVLMSIEDEIEAKLAAISLKEGVAIGPPPSRNLNMSQGHQHGGTTSYAKIVRKA